MSYQPKVYRKQGGDELVVASGGNVTYPVQTLGTSQTATALIFGGNVVTASTTAPAYTLPAPVVGRHLWVGITSFTSGAGDSAVINCNSTGVAVSSSGDNAFTLGTTAQTCHLFAPTTAAWLMLGGSPASPGTSAQST